jgi:hypothetical protein
MPSKKAAAHSSGSIQGNHTSKSKPPEKEVRIVDLPHEDAPGFVSVFTDTCGFATNFYSVTLVFGGVVSRQAKGPYVEDRAAVAMSWEHAKALADILTSNIEAYEKQNGLVRSSPNLKRL